MKKIYVVMGMRGDYSDHTEWPVIGLWDPKRAEEVAFGYTKAIHDVKRVVKDDERHSLAWKKLAEFDETYQKKPHDYQDYGQKRGPLVEEVYRTEKIAFATAVASVKDRLDPNIRDTTSQYELDDTDYYVLEIDVEDE